MYGHLLRNKFPVRAIHMPPFRSHGMTGNRLLPCTVYKWQKLNWDGGLHKNHYNELKWKCQMSKIYESLSLLGVLSLLRKR